MKDFYKETALDNIEQYLTEAMADFLDRDIIYLEEACGGFGDPNDREESELHIRMAKAAMVEYKKSIEQQ